MPIPYIRASFLNLKGGQTIRHIVGYVGRLDLANELAQDANFSRFTDAAYRWVSGPGSPTEADVARIVEAFDVLEGAKRRKPWRERKRFPQPILQLVVALPNDDLLGLDDAIELTDRIAEEAIQGQPLIRYSAIHDPRLSDLEQLGNRHAHILIFMRAWDGTNPVGKRIRNLIGAPREIPQASSKKLRKFRSKHSKSEPPIVVEALKWPCAAWAHQTAYFRELALDLTVDPPAPVGGWHYSGRLPATNVDALRRKWLKLNSEIVQGNPVSFVETALRGRASLPLHELKILVEKFGNLDVSEPIAEILGDPGIIGFARQPSKKSVEFVTSAKVHSVITSAIDTVIFAGEDSQKPRVFSRPDLAGVVDAIAEYVAADKKDSSTLIIDPHESFLKKLTLHLPLHEAEFQTPSKFLSDEKPEALRAERIVIPRSNAVDDQTLAKIISKTRNLGSALVIGFAQNEAAAASAPNQFASFIVSRTMGLPSAGSSPETLLRAGLIQQAVCILSDRGQIRLHDRTEDARRAKRHRLIVATRARSRKDNVPLYDARESVPVGMVPLPHNGSYAGMSVGDPVAVIRTIYSNELSDAQDRGASQKAMPKLRQGRLAKITGIGSSQNVEIEFENGEIAEVDPEDGIIRLAHVITISEARRSKSVSGVCIVEDSKDIFSALLLAARNTKIFVDISRKIAFELTDVVEKVEKFANVVIPSNIDIVVDEAVFMYDLMKSALGQANSIFPNGVNGSRGPSQEDESANLGDILRTAKRSNPEINISLDREFNIEFSSPLARCIAQDRSAQRGLLYLYARLSSGDENFAHLDFYIDRNDRDGTLFGFVCSQFRVGAAETSTLEIETEIGPNAIPIGTDVDHQSIESFLFALVLLSQAVRVRVLPNNFGPR